MKYLISLICLALPVYLIRFSFFSIPTTGLEVLIYLVFIYGILKAGSEEWQKLKGNFWWPIGILLIVVAISVLISPDKISALGYFKAYFIDPILVFVLIIVYLKKEDFKWLVYGLAGSSLIVSIYSIWQKITGQITIDNRVIGIFGDSPNYVALFLAPIAVLLTAYGLQLTATKKYLLSTIYFLLSIISIYALILSGSRAGLLAVVFGLAIYLICHYWSKIKSKLWLKIVLIILALISIIGMWFVFRPNFNASSGRVVSSNNVRWQIWQTSFEMIGQHPVLGVGLGNYQDYFKEMTKDRANFPEFITPMAMSPHNIFLMFWLNLGILGLLGFLGILGIFYLTGFKNILQKESAILVAVMSAILISGLVDTPYFKNDLSLLFWLIFGFILLFYKRKI